MDRKREKASLYRAVCRFLLPKHSLPGRAHGVLCCAALLMGGGAAARALADAPRQAAGTGDKWALLIGIDDYGPNIPHLQCPSHDASSLKALLTNPRIGGFAADHVVLMTTDSASGLQPTRENIRKALETLARKAHKGDTFWFYFSGHGEDRDQSSYLLPKDVRIEALPATSLSTRTIRDLLSKECQATWKVIVLDACHSGSSKGVKGIQVEPVAVAPNTVMLAACQANQSAFEFPDLPGSVFTYYLIRGLAGDADGNHDGQVTVSEVKQYLEANVEQAVEKREGMRQTPVIIAKNHPDIPLTQDAPAGSAPPATYRISPDSKLQARLPLGPTLLVSLSERRTLLDGSARDSDMAQTAVKSALLAKNFPLIDTEAIKPYSTALQGDDKQAAAEAGAKLEAQYLLLGKVETSASQVIAGFTTVTATITAQMLDAQGKVLAATTVTSDPKASGTELQSATQAIDQATSRLLEKMLPALTAAQQNPSSPAPEDHSP